MSQTHTIHTGLYSDKFFNLFADLKAINNVGSRADRRNINFLQVQRGTDNEVILCSDSHDPNGCYSYFRTVWHKFNENSKILDWFGWYIKCMVKQLNTVVDWKRDNTSTVRLFDRDYTVQELYFIYEYLRARKRADSRYSTEIINGWKGQPLDPIAAELEANRREEEKQIKAKYASMIKDCDYTDWQYSWRNLTPAAKELAEAVKKIKTEISAKWDAKRLAFETQMNKELTDLNETVKQTLAFSM